MSFFDIFRRHSHKDSTITFEGAEIGDKRDIENSSLKFSTPMVTRTRRTEMRRQVDFFKPEYDLPTLANAVQLDGYLRRITNIYVEQIMKNGFNVVSKDDKLQEHVNKRITEIERFTGITLREIINEVAIQLVIYGNAYILKVRQDKRSIIGRKYEMFGKETNPIVGLFVLDSSTIEIGVNKTGKVTTYKQVIRGNERYWDENDIIHLTYNKIPGTLTGMSIYIPVLDDVRALRKFEEEMELLGFQYSMPLYLYKVGNKDQPPAPGEVEAVSNKITNMPPYGILVVPGHHSIEVPSNSNTPVDIIKFVEHFKRRVFSGTGVSPLAMGEADSTNRNTGEILDSAMQAITISYQSIIKNKFEMEFLRELMLDGNYKALADKAIFSFPEIDIEKQLKYENGIIALWQNNLITDVEARLKLDQEVGYDINRTHLHMVQIPLIEESASIKAANTSATKNKNENDTKPKNQHGTSTGRPKFVKNYVEDAIKYNSQLTSNLLSESGIKSNFCKKTYLDKIKLKVYDSMEKQIVYNISKYNEFYHLDSAPDYKEHLDDIFDMFVTIVTDKINRFSNINDSVGQLHDTTTDLINNQYEKINNLTKCLLYKDLGFKTILIDAERCSEHATSNLDVGDISYKNLPPFKSNCDCRVDEEGFYGFNT